MNKTYALHCYRMRSGYKIYVLSMNLFAFIDIMVSEWIDYDLEYGLFIEMYVKYHRSISDYDNLLIH